MANSASRLRQSHLILSIPLNRLMPFSWHSVCGRSVSYWRAESTHTWFDLVPQRSEAARSSSSPSVSGSALILSRIHTLDLTAIGSNYCPSKPTSSIALRWAISAITNAAHPTTEERDCLGRERPPRGRLPHCRSGNQVNPHPATNWGLKWTRERP